MLVRAGPDGSIGAAARIVTIFPGPTQDCNNPAVALRIPK